MKSLTTHQSILLLEDLHELHAEVLVHWFLIHLLIFPFLLLHCFIFRVVILVVVIAILVVVVIIIIIRFIRFVILKKTTKKNN